MLVGNRGFMAAHGVAVDPVATAESSRAMPEVLVARGSKLLGA
jgi:hypothetical protein